MLTHASLMGTIQTVLGSIKPDDLGITDIHEHLICSPPSPWCEQDPDLVLDDHQKATEELESFKDSGGSALVEWSTLDYGRDILALQLLSIQTGVHIVAATGYLKGKYCAPFVAGQSIANLVDLLVDTQAELQKVSWPTREELRSSTTVVLVCIFILGAFLYVVDVVVSFVMSRIGVLPG